MGTQILYLYAEEAFGWILFAFVILSTLAGLVYTIFWFTIFSYENPARRFCKICGAHQELYETAWGEHWEEYRPGNKKRCICKLFV